MNRNRIYRHSPTAGVLIMFLVLLFFGCNSQHSLPQADTASKGTINISVDESFRPVIEAEINVYESSFPETKILAHYKTEADCFRDLFRDTATRMIIVTRGLNDREESFFKDSLNYVPSWDDVASDAVTIVLNRKNTDTLFTLDRLKKQLSGTYGRKQTIVFDGLNATSTVRFAVDSILHGEHFDTTEVKAVKNSRDVLDYVAADPDAIGFVGISWIGNPEDTAQVNMLKKVKMAYVRCDRCADTPYVKPTQFGILAKRYPLVRGLYYIIRENYSGLAAAFANFMQYERGQLIFRRAYLGERMGFGIRQVTIHDKL